MEVKVLGSGCRNCKLLEQAVQEALSETGIRAEVEKVAALEDILTYDVLGTPALVINGKVKAFGKVPSKEEIAAWLAEEKG